MYKRLDARGQQPSRGHFRECALPFGRPIHQFLTRISSFFFLLLPFVFFLSFFFVLLSTSYILFRLTPIGFLFFLFRYDTHSPLYRLFYLIWFLFFSRRATERNQTSAGRYCCWLARHVENGVSARTLHRFKESCHLPLPEKKNKSISFLTPRALFSLSLSLVW